MSRKDQRITELEASLSKALEAYRKQSAELTDERDAAFGKLKQDNELLRTENTRLRMEFKGFLDSITFWKGEL